MQITSFNDDFISPFNNGDHVEIIGVVTKYYNNPSFIKTKTISHIKYIDDIKMSLKNRLLANKIFTTANNNSSTDENSSTEIIPTKIKKPNN